MKKVQFLAALLPILLLAGCSVPETGVRPYLPESDLYYCRTTYTEPAARLQTIADRLDLSLQQSGMPDRRKRELCAMIAAFRLVLLKSGAAQDLESGTSGVRLPGDAGFLTTRALASTRETPSGVLWETLGREGQDIRGELAKLPADTIAAFSFELRTEDVARQTAEIMGLFARMPTPPGLLPTARALAGRWKFLCRPGKENVFIELSVPDRDQRISTLLKTFFPPRADGSIRLPAADSGIEPVILTENETLKLRLGTPAGTPAGSLLEREDVQNALPHLPGTGAGWFYLAPGWGKHLDLSASTTPVDELPHQLAILTVRPNALILRSVSSWDPVSEAWLMPIVLFGAEPLGMLLTSGEQVRDAALDRQSFTACERQLTDMGQALRGYAARHGGRFPAGHDIEGFRELLKTGLLAPDKIVCPAAHGDTPARDAASFTYDNCSYVYVGGSAADTPGDFPLVFDWPLNHRDRFHVLTVGGKVAAFHLENLDSCRKLASFLQSRFRYPEPDFRRLLEAADKLDAKFLKGHSK